MRWPWQQCENCENLRKQLEAKYDECRQLERHVQHMREQIEQHEYSIQCAVNRALDEHHHKAYNGKQKH